MEDQHEILFYKLIRASGKLATVSDQASVVLDEQFETLVRPSVDEVRAILAECPTADGEWDGELREEDLQITEYRSEHQSPVDGPVGVKIVHLPTGIGRSSHSKNSQLQNREVAMKALRKAVDEEHKKR